MAKRPATRPLAPERLRQLMKNAGDMSQAELARIAGVDPAQPNRWLKKGTPGGDALEAICLHFGCSPGFLFGRGQNECADYILRVVLTEMGTAAYDALRSSTQEVQGEPNEAGPPRPGQPIGSEGSFDIAERERERLDQAARKRELLRASKGKNRPRRRAPRG